MDPYSAAIARSVKPNDAVMDLGCGPGVFALLACKAGARRVYAIDTNGVVEFGRQLAAANGFSREIIFMCGDSRQIHLPERVNVIVSDIRGVLPLFLTLSIPLRTRAIGSSPRAANVAVSRYTSRRRR